MYSKLDFSQICTQKSKILLISRPYYCHIKYVLIEEIEIFFLKALAILSKRCESKVFVILINVNMFIYIVIIIMKYLFYYTFF